MQTAVPFNPFVPNAQEILGKGALGTNGLKILPGIIATKRKDSLETRVELAVLRTYVENQAILEPILLYRASKCKQIKEQGSEDCLWTHIFTFL